MTESEGEFRKARSGLLHFARVLVHVERGSGTVTVRCSGDGFTSQGTFEDAPATGYDDWKAGAVAGVRYALSLLGRLDLDVAIVRITGLSTDTNATIVGAAAARAVWNAFGFEPSAEEWARVETIVFASWQSARQVPEFQ